jgi:hypothetical protein
MHVLNPIHLLILAGLSALGSLPIFFSDGMPGFDASSHVAKTAFFMYSISHGNFLGWSEFWYSGFQQFYTYSPLTYVLAAVLGWPVGSALVGMKTLVFLSFVASGLGAFALARDLGISPNWSVVGGLLYTLASPHILIVLYEGSSTYSLAFAFGPFLLLSARRALRDRSLRSMALFGGVTALMIISNVTTTFVIVFPLLTYFLISIPGPGAFRSVLVLVGSMLIGLLLSAFWFLPYLELELSGQLNLLTESKTGAYPSQNVIHWYTFFIQSPGNANAGDVGWVLLLPAVASIVFLKRREEFALLGAVIVSTLLTIGPTLSSLFYKIPLLLALQFSWRFMPAEVLFTAPLAALFFSRISGRLMALSPHFFSSSDDTYSSPREGETAPPLRERRREKKKVIAILLLLLVILVPIAAVVAAPSIPKFMAGFVAQQTPSDPNQREAFDFLASQPGFFRVMVIDRYYEAFPEFTQKGSIDGWYDQGATQAYRNFTYNLYYCGANEKALGALQLLGARYVLIDYGYGRDATGALQSYSAPGSPFGPAVFKNSEVEIFQVPDSQLVYVTSAPPNGGFPASQDVNCSLPIPSAPVDDVRYSVSDMNWGEVNISFVVDVNETSYVLVSSAYAPGWVAEVNGSAAPILLSPPGLPVIHVPAGEDRITLRYVGTPLWWQAASLSAITGAVVMATTMLLHRRRRRSYDD